MKIIAVFAIVFLACFNGALGTATLTATSDANCVNVTLTCTTTATVSAVQGDAGAAIQFFNGDTLKFQLNGNNMDMSTEDETNFPDTELTATDNSGNLEVLIASFPSGESATDWSCAVQNGTDVEAEASVGDYDLTTVCSGAGHVTLNLIFLCGAILAAFVV